MSAPSPGFARPPEGVPENLGTVRRFLKRPAPLWILALAGALVACSEKPQSHGLTRNDAAPSAGTGKVFTDAGWKSGDKASWEEHLKVRTRRGQDDYYANKN